MSRRVRMGVLVPGPAQGICTEEVIMKKAFDFPSALGLFKHTLRAPGPRGYTVGPDIADAMLELANEETVTAVSHLVSDTLASGLRVWITSDLHFNHERMISFCDRPFRDVETMNSALRRQLLKVGEDDLLIIAGDVVMGAESNILALFELPGQKILVTGNHDFTYSGKPRFTRMVEPGGDDVFDYVVPFLYWTEGYSKTARPVMVTHFPLDMPASYDPAVSGQIKNYHGHLHDEFKGSTLQVKYVNVCWDVNHGVHCL